MVTVNGIAWLQCGSEYRRTFNNQCLVVYEDEYLGWVVQVNGRAVDWFPTARQALSSVRKHL